MKNEAKYAKFRKSICTMLLIGSLASCTSVSTKTELLEVDPNAQATGSAYEVTPDSSVPASGVVPYVWEEPMIDVIDVPPGLDPEGRYYRPAHQEIVEIRQGRWQYYDRNKPENKN